MGFCEMVPTITGSGTRWVTELWIPKQTSPKRLRIEATVTPRHALPTAPGLVLLTAPRVWPREPISEGQRAQPLFSPSGPSTNLLKVPAACVTHTHGWCGDTHPLSSRPGQDCSRHRVPPSIHPEPLRRGSCAPCAPLASCPGDKKHLNSV